jgi:hypothetical protein
MESFFHSDAEDASVLLVANTHSHLCMELGACSRWLRPHQTRWTAAGGFAFPLGHGDGEGFAPGVSGLPGLDWRVILQFNPAPMGWIIPADLPTSM